MALAVATSDAPHRKAVVNRADGGSAVVELTGSSLALRVRDSEGNIAAAKTIDVFPDIDPDALDTVLTTRQVDPGRVLVEGRTPFLPGYSVEIRSDDGNEDGLSLMAYDPEDEDLGEVYAMPADLVNDEKNERQQRP